MLQSDYDIIDMLAEENTDFRELFKQHVLLEQDLEALYSLKYFPPEVESRIKDIKKAKLKLKDEMYSYVQRYKSDN